MNIVGKRKLWFALSLLIVIPGLISMLYRWSAFGMPLNLGIDFTGGNLFNIEFQKGVTVSEIREALGTIDLDKSQIQMSGERGVVLRTELLDDVRQDKMLSTLQDKIGPIDKDKLSSNKVGPVIGKELTQKAIFALLIASVLMVVYITLRFEFRFAIAAIIALLHDVLVTLGLFSIFWWEVDSAFVAAILTIIGYSINDTIVIFDRIRENLKRRKKTDNLESMVNESIMQTLTRSINTVLTVVFVLVALLLFGGPTIKNFSLALLIGVVSGAYSSIFNASPMWYVFRGIGKHKA